MVRGHAQGTESMSKLLDVSIVAQSMTVQQRPPMPALVSIPRASQNHFSKRSENYGNIVKKQEPWTRSSSVCETSLPNYSVKTGLRTALVIF